MDSYRPPIFCFQNNQGISDPFARILWKAFLRILSAQSLKPRQRKMLQGVIIADKKDPCAYAHFPPDLVPDPLDSWWRWSKLIVELSNVGDAGQIFINPKNRRSTMKVSQAVKMYLEYQRENCKKKYHKKL